MSFPTILKLNGKFFLKNADFKIVLFSAKARMGAMRIANRKLDMWKWNSNIVFTIFCIACFFMSVLSLGVHGVHLGIVDTGVMLLFLFLYFFNCNKIDFLTILPWLFIASMGWSVIFNIFIEKIANLSSLVLFVRLTLIFSAVGGGAWLAQQKDEIFNKVILSLFFGLLVTCIIGIILYAYNVKISPDQQVIWFENGPVHLRAGGVVGNTGAFGHQIFLLFSLASFVLYMFKDSIYKWLSVLIAFSLVFFDLIISSSRGALLGIISFFVIYLFTQIRKKSALLLVALSLVIASTFSYLFLDDNVLTFSARRIGLSSVLHFDHNKNSAHNLLANKKEIYSIIDKEPHEKNKNSEEKITPKASEEKTTPKISEENFSTIAKIINDFSSGRLSTWERYIENVYKHLFWGIGYKNSMNHYGLVVDNSFMSIFVEGGVISLALFVFIWGEMIKRSVAIYRFANKEKGGFLVAFMLANLVQSFFIDIYSQWISFPIFLIVAYAIALRFNPHIAQKTT